jgi:hypothetical protein
MKKIIRYLLRDQVDFIVWILCIVAFIVHLITGIDLSIGFILAALWGFRMMMWNGQMVDKNQDLLSDLAWFENEERIRDLQNFIKEEKENQ